MNDHPKHDTFHFNTLLKQYIWRNFYKATLNHYEARLIAHPKCFTTTTISKILTSCPTTTRIKEHVQRFL